jgi:hypothetical protein
MNKQHELIGTLVLVHPNLTNDPADRKNQIGIISSVDLENDEIEVSFGFDGQSSFSTDALLVMRSSDEIEHDAANDVTLLPFYDYQDILDILMFMDSPLMVYRRHTIELSSKCPEVLEYTMHSLECELGLKRNKNLSR